MRDAQHLIGHIIWSILTFTDIYKYIKYMFIADIRIDLFFAVDIVETLSF